MTQIQVESLPIHCPRCGGLMHKPSGSSLYWHADNNHPRCDITNIVETSVSSKTADESLTQPIPASPPPKGKGQKK